MTIKEFLEKIKKFFLGDEPKRLTDGVEKSEQPNSRGGFLSRLRADAQPQRDMEQEYLELVSEYNSLAERVDIIDSKWALIGNGISESEWPEDEKDLPEFAKKRREAFLEASAKDEFGHLTRFGIAMAELKWDSKESIYRSSVTKAFLESKQREFSGENVVLSEEEQMKVQEGERYYDMLLKSLELRGGIQGMQYAAYTHGLSTEENQAEIDRIETDMEKIDYLILALRKSAEEKGLTLDSLDRQKRAEVVMDITHEKLFIIALMNAQVKSDEAFRTWSEFIENGGRVSLDTFKTPIYSSISASYASPDATDRLVAKGKAIAENGQNEPHRQNPDEPALPGKKLGENILEPKNPSDGEER